MHLDLVLLVALAAAAVWTEVDKLSSQMGDSRFGHVFGRRPKPCLLSNTVAGRPFKDQAKTVLS
jgi:hypothetical protein